MEANEKQIRLAAKMYEMRETAKRIFPKLWADNAEKMKEVIRKMAERDKCSTLAALVTLGKELRGDAITVLLLTAAAVELMELSE